jgi:hypothetical protein
MLVFITNEAFFFLVFFIHPYPQGYSTDPVHLPIHVDFLHKSNKPPLYKEVVQKSG